MQTHAISWYIICNALPSFYKVCEQTDNVIREFPILVIIVHQAHKSGFLGNGGVQLQHGSAKYVKHVDAMGNAWNADM